MSAFQHVTALVSFVYALALSHLLTRVANLLAAHRRVRFSGLLALEMANAILLVFTSWLALWDCRYINVWSLALIVAEFVYATSVYLVCILAVPQIVDHSSVDLDEFFWDNHPYFYGSFLAAGVLALLVKFLSLSASGDRLFVEQDLTIPPMLIPLAIALFSRRRWVQWSSGVAFLVMMITYTIVFSGTL